MEVDLPVERVWAAFADVASWPRWNPCMWRARVYGGELRVGARLVWVFNAIRWWYPYKLPATARIVECEPGRTVTWEVRTAGLHALHSYRFEPLGDGRSRFGSWEVAKGPSYRWLRRLWLAHFRYVCQTSLEGARSLADAPGPGVRLKVYGARTEHPPILAVPGVDGSPGSIEPIVERLARRRQVLVADYSAEQNRTLEDLADEVAAVVAAAEAGPVDLLGQSIGTLVAAHVATSDQVDVRNVVLIATFTRARSTALRVSNLAARLSPRPVYRLMVVSLMSWVCGPVGDGRHHPFLAAVRRSNPRESGRRTAWQIGRDFTSDLRALRQPTLVLMGDQDRFVPDIQSELRALRSIFGPQRVVAIPDAGHVVMPSAAIDRAVAEIEAFLA